MINFIKKIWKTIFLENKTFRDIREHNEINNPIVIFSGDPMSFVIVKKCKNINPNLEK